MIGLGTTSFFLLLNLISNYSVAQLPKSGKVSNPQTIKINQIQVIGSHNSYKLAIEPELMSRMLATDSSLLSLDYQHLTLTAQLDIGLRKLELDVFHDPQGGKYANPLGLELLRQSGVEPSPYDRSGKMLVPGFKVLHIQDIDFRSTCLLLKDCLQEIKTWSDNHPNHLPIAISFNTKSSAIDLPGSTIPLKFTSITFDSLDTEILSVIPPARIITPDDVRGNFNSLEEAVLAKNWPDVENARQKFLFILDEKGTKLNEYVKGHPSLKGRTMFVNTDPEQPEAAFIISNDPIRDQEKIQNLVKNGYLVRTRADANTLEARTGDYSRFESALSSGAQFISTDYYVADKRLDTEYKIALPNGLAVRCNPVLSNPSCNDGILQDK